MSKPVDLIAQWSWKDHWDRSIDEAVSELEREAHVRQRCFDRWVSDGRVSYIDARDRQERLLTAIRRLRELEDITAERDRLSSELATVIEIRRSNFNAKTPVVFTPEDMAPVCSPAQKDLGENVEDPETF